MAGALSAEFDGARLVAHEARATMLAIQDEPWRNAKSIFPAVWCEWASIAVSEVLIHRGMGEWTFVSAGLPDSPSSHAWLELRDENEACQFSIDITLDQFAEWNEPFVGEGPTPARTRFTETLYAGPWREWPEIARNDTYARYAAKVVAYFDGA